MTEQERVPRERLYQELWDEPATTVAARYGVTSTAIAKVCTRLNIPTPSRGYWQKTEAGQSPPVEPLPGLEPGDEIEWARGYWSRPRTAPFPPPEAPQPRQDKAERPRTRLKAGHPLTTIGEAIYERAKETDEGFLRPRASGAPDIYASRETLPRALSLATELYRTLEKRGHVVELGHPAREIQRSEIEIREEGAPRNDWDRKRTWTPGRLTIVNIGTVPICLSVFETTRSMEVAYVDGKYVPVNRLPGGRLPLHSWTTRRDTPTGKLNVQAASPYRKTNWVKRWSEADGGSLRSRLNDIADVLEAAAPLIVEQFHEAQRVIAREEEEHREFERRRQAEERERHRLANLKAAREELEEIVQSWGHARRLEDFFRDVEGRIEKLSDGERTEFQERLGGARELLGGVDALARFKKWVPPEGRR